ncbi:hypothetical protein [Streptomyces longwoodensis]|uniref:hypothetical protein n=1 Tax=Streptomyces longwoodensis TaxID=68231 RepID=UPI00340A1084
MSLAYPCRHRAHEQVGFPEAHAKALSAQLALTQFALGQKKSGGRWLCLSLLTCVAADSAIWHS